MGQGGKKLRIDGGEREFGITGLNDPFGMTGLDDAFGDAEVQRQGSKVSCTSIAHFSSPLYPSSWILLQRFLSTAASSTDTVPYLLYAFPSPWRDVRDSGVRALESVPDSKA